MYNDDPEWAAPPTGGWWASLSAGQQLGYGCFAIVMIGAFVMYCAGTISWLARPALTQREPTPTMMARSTVVPTLTLVPPTFIKVPGGTLVATPTQMSIPTRVPPSLTPTVDLTNPAPAITTTVTLTATVTRTPTRRTTPTLMPRP